MTAWLTHLTLCRFFSCRCRWWEATTNAIPTNADSPTPTLFITWACCHVSKMKSYLLDQSICVLSVLTIFLKNFQNKYNDIRLENSKMWLLKAVMELLKFPGYNSVLRWYFIQWFTSGFELHTQILFIKQNPFSPHSLVWLHGLPNWHCAGVSGGAALVVVVTSGADQHWHLK